MPGNPANIRLYENVLKTSSRRLQDVFSVTFFCLPRRLEGIIAKRLTNTSWRRLGRRFKDVLKTSWRRFRKTSWRRPEDILGRRIFYSRRLQEVLEDEKCYAEDVSRPWKQEMFAGNLVSIAKNIRLLCAFSVDLHKIFVTKIWVTKLIMYFITEIFSYIYL